MKLICTKHEFSDMLLACRTMNDYCMNKQTDCREVCPLGAVFWDCKRPPENDCVPEFLVNHVKITEESEG